MPTREPSMTAGGTAPASRLRVLVVSHVFDPEPFRINQVVADLVVAGAEATVLTGQPNYPEGRVYPGYSATRSGVTRHPCGYDVARVPRSEEHTSELQSLMRTSYSVFCLNKKQINKL